MRVTYITTRRLTFAISFFVAACAGAPRESSRTKYTAISLQQIERRMMAAVIDTVAKQASDAATTLCISVYGGPRGLALPDTHLLALLHTRQRPVPMAQCPRTYASMILVVDSLGRPADPPPPGHIDPHQLAIGRPQFQTTRDAFVYVVDGYGTGGVERICSVEIYRDVIRAHCSIIRSFVS